MNGPHPPTPLDCPDWMRAWALFLDIDGTLLDLAPEPQAVRIPPGLPAQLAALARGLDGALALVSGRPLSDIDRFFPGGFDAAGTHGAQWRLGGTETGPGATVDAALVGIFAALQEEANRLPGIILERKPHALALHYRQAPEREAQVRSLAERAAQSLGPAFRLQTGKLVIELLPVEAGKGGAIQRFMGLPPYAGRTPVFVGDDRTDEDGFAVVNRLGGYAVRVGDDRPTQARFQLHVPAAVRDWLAGLAASLLTRPS
jgi:trehalose 6-phosphate phosphatase